MDAAARALVDFQEVMRQFLEIEQHVLTAYLSCGPSDGTDVPDVTQPAIPLQAPAWVAPILSGEPAPSAPEAAVLRLITRIVDRPARGERAGLAAGHVVVVTGDGHGVTRRVVERLRAEGLRVALVAVSDLAAGEDVFRSAVDSPAEAVALVSRIEASCGPVAALVHLIPMGVGAGWEELDADEATRWVARSARTLFLLAQALRPSLERAAEAGGAAVLAATTMGGAFGTTAAGMPTTWFPGQGGVTGFVKCLAIEWPGVRARTIDFPADEAPDIAAAHMVDELWTEDRETEVGYLGARRIGIDVMPVPAMLDRNFAISSDSVILATGGARGITADICLELAERYQPTFVLVGQSSLPDPVEDPATARLTAPADLKRLIIERLKAEGRHVTPAVVERACQRVLKEREIRGVMGQLTAAGARVHYVAMDVRHSEAFGSLIDEVYSTYGRLDGVIHGAGIIEDKLIRDKSVDSFDAVVATKAASAFVLSRKLRPEGLRFVVFFTSVAGRFGNRGQADYAVANEVVNKLAIALNQRWPGRVCAINWGPWDKRGMVSPELKREFQKRGVELVSPAEGRRAFWEEIQQPAADPAEVVVAGASGMALSAYLAKSDAGLTQISAAPHLSPAPRQPLPLMVHAARTESMGGAVKYTRVIDPAVDRYLDDHRLDDKPVLPLAFATELMAEAAQATWPDLRVVAVRRLQLFKGISVEGGPVPAVITVRAPVHLNEEGLTEADVDISTPTEMPPVRYRAVVELAAHGRAVPLYAPPEGRLPPLEISVREAYQRWTFHGPLFQRVTAIEGISADRMIGRIVSGADAEALQEVPRPGWIIDPFVFDAALQLLLIWSRATNDKTALPSRFRAFTPLAPMYDKHLVAYIDVESLSGGHGILSDVHFVDDRGQLVAILEGMEANCSSALNRLASRGADAARARP